MVREIAIHDINGLIQSLNTFPNNYIFRGHADATWKLQPTLERVAGSSFTSDFVTKAEQLAISRFKAKFHLYDTQNEAPQTDLEWLSIMQHYGAPTRLLDFTASPYLALFFAVEHYEPSSRKHFAIYAVDHTQLMNASFAYIRAKDSKFTDDYQAVHLAGRQDEVFENVASRFLHPILWITEPSRFNVRIDRQAGCFLLACEKSRSIEQVLDEPHYSTVDVAKFTIEPALYEGCFALLRKMNISPSTIYGDLGGLGATVRMELRAYAAGT
jgi:hypothetical protein